MNEAEARQPGAQTIGAILKKRRRQRGLSLANVELATKIRGKYLVWIESSDFANLPNDIYTRGFVNKYADFLGLDTSLVLKQYDTERGEAPQASVASPTPVGSRRVVVTPRLMIAAVFVLVVGLTLVYLGWQFSALAAPPKLTLNSPPDNTMIEGGTITVAGQVAGGADVFVNESPILIDASGNFSNKLALQDGVNQIKITAKNKLGKTTTLTRNVLAHLPSVSGQPLVPALPTDGVTVGVIVRDQTINLTIKLDDGTAETITMLPGTRRAFTAKTKVSVITNNSAATQVQVTNSTIASKDLGVVGKGGELKLEFSRDTAFQ